MYKHVEGSHTGLVSHDKWEHCICLCRLSSCHHQFMRKSQRMMCNMLGHAPSSQSKLVPSSAGLFLFSSIHSRNRSFIDSSIHSYYRSITQTCIHHPSHPSIPTCNATICSWVNRQHNSKKHMSCSLHESSQTSHNAF